MSITPALVLAAMVAVQPNAPWRATYESTAEAIANEASAHPLFDGEDGTVRTAALLVSLAWFEGAFRPDAVGDGGASVGMFQVNGSALAFVGATREELLRDTVACVSAGRRIAALSLSRCRALPADERLSLYASGSCTTGRRESRHRMAKAAWVTRRIAVQDAHLGR